MFNWLRHRVFFGMGIYHTGFLLIPIFALSC